MDELTPVPLPVPTEPIADTTGNVSMPQATFNTLIADRAARAKAKGQADLARSLGFDTVDALTRAVQTPVAVSPPVAVPVTPPADDILTRLQVRLEELTTQLATQSAATQTARTASNARTLDAALAEVIAAHLGFDVETLTVFLRAGTTLEGVQAEDGSIDQVRLSAAVGALKASKPKLFNPIPSDYKGIASNGGSPNPDPSGERKQNALASMRNLFGG